MRLPYFTVYLSLIPEEVIVHIYFVKKNNFDYFQYTPRGAGSWPRRPCPTTSTPLRRSQSSNLHTRTLMGRRIKFYQIIKFVEDWKIRKNYLENTQK